MVTIGVVGSRVHSGGCLPRTPRKVEGAQARAACCSHASRRRRCSAMPADHPCCDLACAAVSNPCITHPPTHPPVSMLAAAMGPGWEGLMTSQAQAAAKPRMASLPAKTSRRRVKEGTSHRPGAL